jgi:hypothetical protein
MSAGKDFFDAQSIDRRDKRPTAAVASVLILIALLVWVDQTHAPRGVSSSDGNAPQLDRQAVRQRAWQKIEPRLSFADTESTAEIDRCLHQIDAFFAERKAGARPFAEVVLSLEGKWKFIRSKLRMGEADEHVRYMNKKFGELVFTPEELHQAIESALVTHFKSVQSIENQLLVRCRADIDSADPLAREVLPELHADAAFAAAYEKMLEAVTRDVAHDLEIDSGRELTSLVVGEIATVIAVRVAAAVAVRLGITGGLVATGSAFSWATLGVGLVAAIVVDISLDWLMKWAGHDPAGKVAAKVEETLDSVRSLFVDGDPVAVGDYRKLAEMSQNDPDEKVRSLCQQSAKVLETSGKLGLRRELQRFDATRAQLRAAAMKKLILTGGTL